jgi:hypothetical protein
MTITFGDSGAIGVCLVVGRLQCAVWLSRRTLTPHAYVQINRS